MVTAGPACVPHGRFGRLGRAAFFSAGLVLAQFGQFGLYIGQPVFQETLGFLQKGNLVFFGELGTVAPTPAPEAVRAVMFGVVLALEIRPKPEAVVTAPGPKARSKAEPLPLEGSAPGVKALLRPVALRPKARVKTLLRSLRAITLVRALRSLGAARSVAETLPGSARAKASAFGAMSPVAAPAAPTRPVAAFWSIIFLFWLLILFTHC